MWNIQEDCSVFSVKKAELFQFGSFSVEQKWQNKSMKICSVARSFLYFFYTEN